MSRIVIFANGELKQPNLLRQRLRADDRIFCANGGTYHALALELTPEIIIGDLDSLPVELVNRLESGGVRLHRHPVDKDKTDLELALELAAAEQAEEVLLAAALGGRLDQALANLLLLSQPQYASMRLVVADGPQTATLLRSQARLTVEGEPGDTLSLLPLTPTVEDVTLTGVKWPLEGATLSFGSTWSISNKLTATQAVVRIGQGMALAVHFGAEEAIRGQ